MTVEEILAEVEKLNDDEVMRLYDAVDDNINERGLWDLDDEEPEEEPIPEEPTDDEEEDGDELPFDDEEPEDEDDDAMKEGVLV